MPPKKEGVPRFLAVNGDESEPGTIKDRRLFEYNPHTIIEGAIIACYAMEMDAAYIYIRGEYADWIDMVQKAIDEAYTKGYAGKNIMGSGHDIDVFLHKGAGAYICGEETSLMESLEGKRAYPRSKPPFPAQKGLWGYPTTINNVETVGQVPYVIRNGADWYLGIGAEGHPGPCLYGISGHVNRPGVYEYPTGMLISLAQWVITCNNHENEPSQTSGNCPKYRGRLPIIPTWLMVRDLCEFGFVEFLPFTFNLLVDHVGLGTKKAPF